MPEHERTDDEKARRVARDAMLSMLSADAIAYTAAKFGPAAYREVARVESAPARAVALVELAHQEGLLDALLDSLFGDPGRADPCDSRVDTQLADAAPEHRLLDCNASTIPVFVTDDPYEVFDITIVADFDVVNQGDINNDESDGRVSYVDPVSGATVDINCRVEARGKSRRQCGWRPLRLHFGDASDGTIFDGTGRFIDMVTHCGYRPGQWEGLAGSDEVEHDRRLHQEFTFYEVLRSFGGMTLETRLAFVTYEDLASGAVLEQRFGFIRERKSRAPLRCGMQRQEADEGDPFRPANATSLFQAEFHHRLLFHHDYYFPNFEHNVVRMTDGSSDFYFPYDFDLSGVIAPNYFKNNGWSVQRNADELVKWLRGQDQPLARTQVAEVLKSEAEIRRVVAGTQVDATGRAELDHWMETHLRALKTFFCGWSPNERIPNQSSKAPSALASYGGVLHLLHLGNSSNNIWHSVWDGESWSPNERIPNQTSKSHPAMAAHAGLLHMVHAGNSSNNIWHSIWAGAPI